MHPAPDPSTKFYVVIGGQAQGPYSAEQVMNLLRQGSLDGNTLICAEGGAAWVPVQELESALRAVAPPVQPAGYGGGAKSPAVVPRAVQQLVIIRNNDTTRTLRLGTFVAALVLFFLPWLEMKCAGQRLIYQSGVQTVLNKGSLDGDMEKMAKAGGGGYGRSSEEFESKEFGKKVGPSFLTAGALLCVVIALAVAFRASGRAASGVMAAVSLVFLGVQAGMGFPLQKAFEKEMGERNHRNGFNEEDAELRRAMGGDMMEEMFAVKFSPWFYGELGLLAAATVMGLSGGGQRRH